jgi:hypothetical protein
VVAYDEETGELIPESRLTRRKGLAPCRDALNGYQKGKCFYCFRDVSVVPGDCDLGEVDHFFPHRLKGFRVADPVDGVWNLVLAYQTCNRGAEGKLGVLPELFYVERLFQRNEFLIASHHPLRETLMARTGATLQSRHHFLDDAYRSSVKLLVQRWRPRFEFAPAF